MREITGVMYAYSFLCYRKLWMFAKDITMEQESEHVSIGKYLDETSFPREHKHILIDDTINIDFVKNGVVYEIKKSKSEQQMAVNQIKYYLYILKSKGIESPKGILSVPTSKYTEEITLEEQDIKDIEARLKLIEGVVNGSEIPPAVTIKACKSCSYYELCYI